MERNQRRTWRGVSIDSVVLCHTLTLRLSCPSLPSLCVSVCVVLRHAIVSRSASCQPALSVATLAVHDEYVIISGRCHCLVSDSKQTTIRLSDASAGRLTVAVIIDSVQLLRRSITNDGTCSS